jgi:anti-anti-sigma factor
MTDPVRKTADNGETDNHDSHDNIRKLSNGADLQITTQKLQADLVLIKLKGTVMNVDNYYELHKIINTFLDYGVYKLIVDLSDLGYMTSMGASIFISGGLVAMKHQGALVLVNPQPKVKIVLDLIGITEICRLVNDLDKAFEALGISNPLTKKRQKYGGV